MTGLTRYALLEAELLRRVIPLALPWKKSRIPDALEMQVPYFNTHINAISVCILSFTPPSFVFSIL